MKTDSESQERAYPACAVPGLYTSVAALILGALLLLGIWSCGSDSSAQPVATSGPNAAQMTERSRDMERSNDFIRAFFVPPGIKVNTFSLPSAFRAFFSDSRFYDPPGTVNEYLTFVGSSYNATNDLIVMRCRPSDTQKTALDPILATWPNLFSAIEDDLGGKGYTCPAPTADGDNEIFCAAESFVDQQQVVYVNGLLTMLQAAAQVFATSESTASIRQRYGAYPAFSGLGFTVAGSANDAQLTDAQVLQQSTVPEYLLINSSLSDGGCRCVQVPTYTGRDQAPMDVDYIWQQGQLNGGACRRVHKLHAQSAALAESEPQ
jgi:hypothetical protein